MPDSALGGVPKGQDSMFQSLSYFFIRNNRKLSFGGFALFFVSLINECFMFTGNSYKIYLDIIGAIGFILFSAASLANYLNFMNSNSINFQPKEGGHLMSFNKYSIIGAILFVSGGIYMVFIAARFNFLAFTISLIGIILFGISAKINISDKK